KDLLDRRPAQLSGGQRQRVALGRAIVRKANAFLLDEPLSNLDAQLRAEMRREIRALQQKLGVTMVYVTHDQSEAMSMADKVILMREGKVEQAAVPDRLYAQPATVFAARFIGTPPMNMITLEVAGGTTIIANSETPILPTPIDALLLGIRPEDVIIAEKGISARVINIEYLGADTVVTCVVGSQFVTARVAGKAALTPGESIHLVLPPEKLHFFDAANGRRRDEVSAIATPDTTNFVQKVLV
ncbi:MAG: TOBE domain-containing protein, partial [Pseudolabrys sp.]